MIWIPCRDTMQPMRTSKKKYFYIKNESWTGRVLWYTCSSSSWSAFMLFLKQLCPSDGLVQSWLCCGFAEWQNLIVNISVGSLWFFLFGRTWMCEWLCKNGEKNKLTCLVPAWLWLSKWFPSSSFFFFCLIVCLAAATQVSWQWLSPCWWCLKETAWGLQMQLNELQVEFFIYKALGVAILWPFVLVS